MSVQSGLRLKMGRNISRGVAKEKKGVDIPLQHGMGWVNNRPPLEGVWTLDNPWCGLGGTMGSGLGVILGCGLGELFHKRLSVVLGLPV